jgi:hypothetical protein
VPLLLFFPWHHILFIFPSVWKSSLRTRKKPGLDHK